MAKFRVGQTVKIEHATDDNFPTPFMNRVGRVKQVVTKSKAPIGESTKDPFYIVAVPFIGTDGFWTEELRTCG